MCELETTGTAVAYDLDDCIGCFACEAACRETNRYPYDEEWLRCIRQEPYMIDGKLRQYHVVFPSLDKCAACFAKDPNPLCVGGCPSDALFIGSFSDTIEWSKGRNCAIYASK